MVACACSKPINQNKMLENGSTSSSPPAATADETINQLKQNLVLEHHHKEKHFLSSEVVRDIIIGVSDGLTVPFALAAGLSSVEATSRLILVAGIAEVAAGAISMGLGGYLAAKSEADHYMRELKREEQEIILVPDIEAAECGEILAQYGVEPKEAEPVLNALRRNPHHWLTFMMK
ncbi:Vacuolar iron transporter 1 [Linum perenne]